MTCLDHGEALAPYAVTESQSRGRRHEEAPPAFRSQFQRDRDRVIHSSAFRRLEYKTQVFVNHEGDMFRTRLTHSLEVAQIARTVARTLRLNEDLTEAIALAHDLGHTPFGHSGQSALNYCMRNHGGFEHNRQSLRVVEQLEERYPEFHGLNLLFETREGILKHCSVEAARGLGTLGERFLNGEQPSLEAQLANIADEIAYNHHDLDDGLRANLLDMKRLTEFSLFGDLYYAMRRRWKDTDEKKLLHSVIREMLNRFVTDLVDTTRESIERHGPDSLTAVRTAGSALIGFSSTMRAQHIELKRLLRRHLYFHSSVQENSAKARGIVRDLFEAFYTDPDLLPDQHAARAMRTPGSRAEIIADYIAGMTDRFAIAEHTKIYRREPFAA